MACFDIDDKHENSTSGRFVTDVCWLCGFLIFCTGMIIIATFSYVYGDPRRMIYGSDSFGNVCGAVNQPLENIENTGKNLVQQRYLFFFDIQNPMESVKICVNKCPDRILKTPEDLQNFAKDIQSPICRYDIPLEAYSDIKEYELSLVCPNLPVYPSSPVLNRCIPESITNLSRDIVYNIHGYLNSMDLFQRVLADIYASWREMIILAAVACFLSAVMVLVINFLVSCIFWIVAVGVSLAFIGGTSILWWTYVDIKERLDAMPTQEMLEEMVQNERAFLAYSIIATVITVIFLLIIICLRNEVPKVSMLFEEAANCMLDMPFLFLLPFFTVIILLIFFIFWISVILCLATAFHPSKQVVVMNVSNEANSGNNTQLTTSNIDMDTEFTLINYVDPSWVRYMWWYLLIALLWISEFILACQQMVMSRSIVKWYFATDRSTLSCPIGKSIGILIMYHIGSVAKGAFLITVFKLPRLVFTYIQEQLNKSDSSQKCQRCCSTLCCCCLQCLDKFLKYISHNAFTVIVDGRNFCPAAREAFDCLASNAFTVATLNSAGDFVLFLGKCFIAALTGIIGLLVMKHNTNLYFYAVPILISCIFAYFIAHCVLSLFEIVVDTLVLCYCQKSDYAPENLRACFKKGGEDGDELEMQALKPVALKTSVSSREDKYW